MVNLNKKFFRAFTLAEVLITLGVIGVVAALAVPNLIQNSQEAQWVAGLQKFNSNLQQAIQLWKEDIGCMDSAYNCLTSQNLGDNVCSNFDQIIKFMKIDQSLGFGINTNVNWLPSQTLNYYGTNQTGSFGGVSNSSVGLCRYRMQDGTAFGLDVDTDGFAVWVDTNGKKLPNRIGKDTFPLTIGFSYNNKDINYYALDSDAARNAQWLCSIKSNCNPNNTDPTKDNGASPTAYVILNNKIPDFKALASTVTNFKP